MRTTIDCVHRAHPHAKNRRADIPMWRSTVGIMLAFALGLVVSWAAVAQQPAKVPRIGVLMPALNPERTQHLEAFRHSLRDLGWVEGQNLALEYRFAEHGLEQFSALAADLVRLKVDVLVAGGGAPAVRAAKEATTTIPIVMVAVGGSPMERGLIDSLAKPGGNITGTVSVEAELMARRFEILKEALPGASRLAVLMTPRLRDGAGLQEVQRAAQAMGIALHVQEVRSPDELPGAFAAMQQAGAEALLVPADSFIFAPHVPTITALALQHRLPVMYAHRMYIYAGGLMYYGTNLRERFQRTAYYVDRILKGTKPADLPVEMPWKFELVINLKTAKALGMTMPPSLLLLADEVIQ
jgi:putative tryptophan/tyrosine transport system substrate-binding protein